MFFAGPILAAVVPVDRRKLLLLARRATAVLAVEPVDRRRRRRRRPTPPARPSTTRHSSPCSTTSSPSTAPVRVEIVPTLRHWEVAEVAPEIPIARGWWRQLDMEYNPLFYDGTLDAATYREWLDREAVSYVAVPHGELDDAGVDEAALIAGGLPYLELDRVLADWTRVRGGRPAADRRRPGHARRVRRRGPRHPRRRARHAPRRSACQPALEAHRQRRLPRREQPTGSSTSPASNRACSAWRSTSSSRRCGTAAPTAARAKPDLSRLNA